MKTLTEGLIDKYEAECEPTFENFEEWVDIQIATEEATIIKLEFVKEIIAEFKEEYTPTLEGFKEWIQTQGAYYVPILVSDGKNSTEVFIGTDPLGDDGYVQGLDLYAPPLPPLGAFGVMLVWENEGYFRDIRSSEEDKHTFVIKYQPASGQAGIVLTWNPEDLAGVSKATIVPITTEDNPVNMKTVNTVNTAGNMDLEKSLRIEIEK